MSAWPGKYVIGLTGNIATGKSVVRRMLEHLGAYGIDADALGHRAIARGAPGYEPVVETFGTWILNGEKQVDRAKLGQIVFSSPGALVSLENIVHPLVGQAIDLLVRRARQKVIVIEAIKLIEADITALCDQVWVTHAPEEVQLARLVEKRRMSAGAARQRISAQPPQSKKLAAADVVINNSGSFEDTWLQVLKAWPSLFPEADHEPKRVSPEERGKMLVQRAGPRQAAEISELIYRLSHGSRKPSRDDIMAEFGEKAFLLLRVDGRAMGLLGWQVENLVARSGDLFLADGISFVDAIGVMMNEVEQASRDLQCEVMLLFLPPRLARKDWAWQELGYQPRSVQELGVRAWQEAAEESMPPGTVMLFKQLRKDRVLRPV